MNKLLLMIGATIGGAFGWWQGSFIGIMPAYTASVVFTAVGIYAARLFVMHYLA